MELWLLRSSSQATRAILPVVFNSLLPGTLQGHAYFLQCSDAACTCIAFASQHVPASMLTNSDQWAMCRCLRHQTRKEHLTWKQC